MQQRLQELERRVAELERARAITSASRDQLETAFGLTWLNRLGAGLVVAGLVLATVWLNEAGHLSAPVRSGLLVIGSIVVLALGVRALRSGAAGRRRFGYGVTAVGALGLYLVPFTASQVDGVVGVAAAGAAAAGLTLALGVAAYRLRLDALATLAAIGGLFVPLIAAGGAPEFIPLFVYLTILGIAALALQRATAWTGLGAIVSAGTGAYYLAAALTGVADGPSAVAGLALFIAPYIDAVARGREPDIAEQAAAGIAVAVAAGVSHLLGSLLGIGAVGVVAFALAWPLRSPLLAVLGAVETALAVALAMSASALAGLCAGVVCGLVCLGVGVAWSSRPARRAGVFVLGASLLRMFAVDVWALSAGMRVGAFLILGGGLLAASFLYSRYADRVVALPIDREPEPQAR